jgi:hypothetical protein
MALGNLFSRPVGFFVFWAAVAQLKTAIVIGSQ